MAIEIFLKVWRVAKRLDVHRSVVYRLYQEGKLKGFKFDGGPIRISETSILEYIEVRKN